MPKKNQPPNTASMATYPPGVQNLIDNALITPREAQVWQLLASGLMSKVVAARLGVTEHTIRLHTTKLFEKLDVKSNVQLAVLYAENARSPEAMHNAIFSLNDTQLVAHYEAVRTELLRRASLNDKLRPEGLYAEPPDYLFGLH